MLRQPLPPSLTLVLISMTYTWNISSIWGIFNDNILHLCAEIYLQWNVLWNTGGFPQKYRPSAQRAIENSKEYIWGRISTLHVIHFSNGDIMNWKGWWQIASLVTYIIVYIIVYNIIYNIYIIYNCIFFGVQSQWKQQLCHSSLKFGSFQKIGIVSIISRH